MTFTYTLIEQMFLPKSVGDVLVQNIIMSPEICHITKNYVNCNTGSTLNFDCKI